MTKLATIVENLTAREIFKHCPEVKKQLWDGEFWMDGYFSSTAGRQGNEETARAYVKGQDYAPLNQDHQLQVF